MSHEINADYEQQFILPPSLEDWVPDDHPARFIRNFVEALDLSKLGFMESAGIDGRPHYSSDMLLKVWLYGYFHKIRSLRGMERFCYNDLGAIWLTGMNYPDHNTLWRFFRDNKKALRDVLLKVTFTAQMNGLIGLVLHALDGTKIRAQVSDSSGWHAKTLKKKLHKLKEGIGEIMQEIESSVETGRFDYHLPEKLQDEEKRREGIESALCELDKINRKHLHPSDKDARMTKCGKGKSFCFNAQAVVDDESSLIVTQDVTNDEADNDMLAPMIEKVEESLGKRAVETVADAGYYSPEQLVKAEEKGYEILVNINESIAPTKEEKPFHKSKFIYDEGKDVFICPLGKELRYERTRKNRQVKYMERVYRCKSFVYCPLRDTCSCEKQGRKITMGPHHGALLRQIQKQKNTGNKELLAKRKQIVEPVFGIIKEIYGFRRFTVRGLENVRTQWSLICTSYNLRKLFRSWTSGNLVIA